MRLRGFFSVPFGVNHVSARCVSMVRCLLVMAGLVMFGCFFVVESGMCMMF